MSVARRLLAYLTRYLSKVVVGVICLAAAGGLMAVVVAALKPLVNDVFVASEPIVVEASAPSETDDGPEALLGVDVSDWIPQEDLKGWLREHAFVEVPLLLVLILALRGVLLFYGQYLIAKVGHLVVLDLRAELFQAIIYQSLGFFRDQPTGGILSRIFNDVQRVQRVGVTTLGNVVRVGAMAPAMLILVLVHDWRTSLFAIIVLPVMVVPAIRLGRRMRRASKGSQERMGEATSLVSDAVTGIRVVQGFAMERFEIGRFEDTLRRMLRVDLKGARAGALSTPIMEFVGAIAVAILLVFAGRSIARGTLDPGDFAVVITGLTVLSMSLRRLNQSNAEIQQALAASERLFEFIDHPPDVVESPSAVPLPPFEREIRFEGIDFAYDDEQVLSGIDLTVRKGETVALVGASGTGKTTLASLVSRFFDPTVGTVSIDGHDLRQVTLGSLRDQIGIVTQETVLFNDSVRCNIAYGRDDVPFEAIRAAARAAHADAFIEPLPDAYDTMIGERGTRFSMGQRQRLSIARALLKDPPILVLDEATSALDSESERLVQDALDHLLEGRTSIVIAHRLATIRNADRIIVLAKGQIAEEGRHEELLARDGVYARLHRLQYHGAPVAS